MASRRQHPEADLAAIADTKQPDPAPLEARAGRHGYRQVLHPHGFRHTFVDELRTPWVDVIDLQDARPLVDLRWRAATLTPDQPSGRVYAPERRPAVAGGKVKTEGIRKASEAPIPWKSPLVALLRISGDTIAAANRVGDKRQLLAGAGLDDLFLAAWPGQYSQDVFRVDNIDDVRAAFGMTR
jgi:hypothetical protein